MEFEFSLSKDELRPTIMLYGRNALIDTGALIPVFSFSEDFIKARFKAKLVKQNKFITGLGSHEVYGDVYAFSNFYIKDLHYKTLEAFVPYEKALSFPILLSAPLFGNTEYEFKPKLKRMVVKVPDELAMNNEFLIKDLAKDHVSVQLNGVLIQNYSSEVLVQKEVKKNKGFFR